MVFKVKDPYAKSPLKCNVQPEDAIYEHLVHNKYFPETAYKFVGISDDLGDVRIVLSQQLVESVMHPTQKQIEIALAEKGLYPEGKYSYGNDEISVTDIAGDNALLGLDGKVYFIDPIIDFKKPVEDILEDPLYNASALEQKESDSGFSVYQSIEIRKNSLNLQHGDRSEQNNDERAQPRETDSSGVADDSAGTVAGFGDRGDIRVYEEGLASSRDEYSEHSERNRREAESERLVKIAKSIGQYFNREQIQTLGERYTKRTGESVVYYNGIL